MQYKREVIFYVSFGCSLYNCFRKLFYCYLKGLIVSLSQPNEPQLLVFRHRHAVTLAVECAVWKRAVASAGPLPFPGALGLIDYINYS